MCFAISKLTLNHGKKTKKFLPSPLTITIITIIVKKQRNLANHNKKKITLYYNKKTKKFPPSSLTTLPTRQPNKAPRSLAHPSRAFTCPDCPPARTKIDRLPRSLALCLGSATTISFPKINRFHEYPNPNPF